MAIGIQKYIVQFQISAAHSQQIISATGIQTVH